MIQKTSLFSVILLGAMFALAAKPTTFPVPYRAFCKIVWLVEISCTDAIMIMVTQIKALDGFQMGNVTAASIAANHTSLDGSQTENITFTMSAIDVAGCHITGSSTSQLWMSRLDNGTNYCNLYNVVQGSGLSSAPGFQEYTNDWLCLGVGTAGCND